MVHLADLWLPILVAAVLVFVVSSIVHMALPWHRSDYVGLPNEDSILDALRGHSLSRGDYMFPHAESMKELGSPEMLEKWKQGPVGILTIMQHGAPSMGKNLAQWFGYCVVISVFVAYLASLAKLPAGAAFEPVFRFASAAAILGYSFNHVLNSIWKGAKWSTSFKFMFDGVLYGLTTAATFAWLWPELSGS